MKLTPAMFLTVIAFCEVGLTQTTNSGVPEGYIALLRSDVQT